MKSVGDVLGGMGLDSRPVEQAQSRPAVVSTGPQPDPECPWCAGRGRVVRHVEGMNVRVLRRNQETHLDEPAVVPYVHEVVCRCMFEVRPVGALVRSVDACGLSRYPLDRWTLDQFRPIGAGVDQQRWQAVLAWADGLPGAVQSRDVPGWVLRGERGMGKTHLTVALINRARHRGVGALLVREVDIVTDLQATYHGDDRSEAAVMARWQRVPVLAIDDVGKAHVPGNADPEAGNAWLASRLYTVLDDRLTAGRTTIISTNLPDAALYARLGTPLMDRLAMLTWVEFTGESGR